MPSLNKVFLIGNLTRDPECRSMQGGSDKATFGFAINEAHRNAQGEKVEKTHFVEVEAWGRVAIFAQDYLKKGTCVFIEGKLNYQTWQDRETGANRNRLTITALSIQFAESKRRDSGGDAGATRQPATDAGGGVAPTEPNEEACSADLPF